MRLERLREMRRLRFFFAFKEELEIHTGFLRSGFQRIEGGKHCDDRRLVVARPARKDARLRVEAPRVGHRHVHPLTVALHTKRRREWRAALPLARDHRLPVVVRVEHKRFRGARRFEFAKHHRWPTVHLKQLRRNAATLHERDYRRCVAAEARGVARDVGECQQCVHFAHDGHLMRGAPIADRLAGGLRE